MAAAVVTPFVLASLFPIVDAIPLEKRGNSTVSRGFEGPTQFGPWTVPFWAYILIIGLITTASITLLVFLVNFLLSISCWTLCSSVEMLLAENAEQRQEKHAHQTHTHQPQSPPPPQPLQHQHARASHDSPTHSANTGFNDHSHVRTYSTHSNGGAYPTNQGRTGNIAPYHQYTLSGLPSAADPYTQRYPQQQHQQHRNDQHYWRQQQQQHRYRQQQELHQYHSKRTAPEAFAFPLVPASMLSPKPLPPPSRASPRPSSELDPVGLYPPPRPPGLEHKYSASH